MEEKGFMYVNRAVSDKDRMGRGDRFRFSCHGGLECFNRCCSNKYIPLTPYDVLRLKTALDLHSDDFLGQYTLFKLEPESGFPVVSLAMGDDSKRTCRFVTESGCSVYENRPTACRLYPLERLAGGREGKDGGWEEIFSLLDTPNCHGREEDRQIYINDWCKEQGLAPYLEMNDRMLDILFHPSRVSDKPLNEAELQKVMVALYDVDVFRDFVFKTPFLERFEVDDETISRIKEDDESLLIFGFSYLKKVLFQ